MAVRKDHVQRGPTPPVPDFAAPSSGGDQRLGYQPQLDGMRALCASLIVVYHIWGDTEPMGGFIGVDVFFVISGYLITTILLREHRKSGGIGLRRFYERRALRLLPALVVVLGFVGTFYVAAKVFFGVHLNDAGATIIGIPASLFYVSSWMLAFKISSLGGLGQTWSLSVEEHFYLIWPAALLLLLRRCPKRTAEIIAAMIAGFAVYRIVVLELATGSSTLRIYAAPDTRMDQLLIGCLLAVLVESGRLRSLSRRVLCALGTVAAVGLVWGMFALPYGDFYYIEGIPLVGLAAAVVIWSLLAWPASLASKALSLAPLVWVGRRSYGIYLWHFPIITLLYTVTRSTWLIAPVTIVATVLAAGLTYRFAEAPMLSRRRY